MSNIIEQVFKRCTGRAKIAAGTTHAADYRRGYLQGLRRHYRSESFGAGDEHVQWLGFADGPAHAEVWRGFRDGIAGVEPQP